MLINDKKNNMYIAIAYLLDYDNFNIIEILKEKIMCSQLFIFVCF